MILYLNKSEELYSIFENGFDTEFAHEVDEKTLSLLHYGVTNIDWESTDSENFVLTRDVSTIMEVSAVYRDQANGEIIYTDFDDTSGSLLSASSEPVFIQAGHMVDQTFSSAGSPQDILFGLSGPSNGITLSDDKVFTIGSSGKYKVSFSAQAEAPGGSNKELQVWFTKNGTAIECSNVYTHVNFNAGEPLPKDMIVDFSAGDTFKVRAQVSNTNARLNFEPASGDIPCVPSAMISINKIL